MPSLRVLLVTSWNVPCGISEHSYYLKQAVEAADPSIEILPASEALTPQVVFEREAWISTPDQVVHLNYQAALHSRWTPGLIEEVKKYGCKVVVTFHDTGVPNSDLCKAICEAADAVVVHEPFDDLPAEKVHYWRMGVPDWHEAMQFSHNWCGRRPILGSIGFAFPWKHYEELAKITARAGWALLLIAPTVTKEQVQEWTALNPHTWVLPEFVGRAEALSLLSGCDATAFGYVCHNTGQSGAILQGIAARKPVIALRTCRQFRALYQDPLGRDAICWCETFEEISRVLMGMSIQRVDPAIVALAEQDSWQKLGQKYAALYRELVP